MAKKFKELRDKMSPEARGRAHAKTRIMLAEMALDELREARKLTQEQLAERFHVGQPAIAKIEKRTDMYLSTLRGIIRAMGGELVIRAVFPDGDVRITQFEDIKRTSVKQHTETAEPAEALAR
jgi:transcriptional regulator with XRE-family HTH domain